MHKYKEAIQVLCKFLKRVAMDFHLNKFKDYLLIKHCLKEIINFKHKDYLAVEAKL